MTGNLQPGWTTDMPQPAQKRAFFPLVSSGSSLFLIGGQDSTGTYLASIARYDISNEAWDESFATLQSGRGKHCAVEHAGKIWIIGGER